MHALNYCSWKGSGGMDQPFRLVAGHGSSDDLTRHTTWLFLSARPWVDTHV